MVTKRKQAGYIYVLKDSSNRRKLGLGIDVDRRRKQLQTGNAEQITIEYRLHVNNMQQAETGLHAIFAAQRLRIGEWFELDEPDLVVLKKIFGAEHITELECKQMRLLGLR